jgi:LemA protein
MGPFSNLDALPLATTFGSAVVFFCLAFFLYVLMIYNNLVRLRVNIGKAWANLDVLLKQRHDEVPNLVAVISGVKDFEKNIMTQVSEARAASQNATGPEEKGEAEKNLSGSLGRLFAVAENYPTLRSQENFLLLQKRLSGLEDEIADRRIFYNDSVSLYNVRILEFPDSLLAKPFGFLPHELFQVQPGDKDPIQVKLSQ